MNCEPSQERLNALIDGELTPADAAALLERLRTDADLRERVSQLRLGKELVRHAYAGIAPAPTAPPWLLARARPAWGVTAAAVLALAGAALLGWTARQQTFGPADAMAKLSGHPEWFAPRSGAGSPLTDSNRVILHVSSSVPEQGRAALDRAEQILRSAHASARRVSVEIVANSGGIDLLRADVSPQVDRIAELRNRYPELQLVACGQTVQRLSDTGTPVRLLPGTIVASSALDEVVLRMQQGWTYLGM